MAAMADAINAVGVKPGDAANPTEYEMCRVKEPAGLPALRENVQLLLGRHSQRRRLVPHHWPGPQMKLHVPAVSWLFAAGGLIMSVFCFGASKVKRAGEQWGGKLQQIRSPQYLLTSPGKRHVSPARRLVIRFNFSLTEKICCLSNCYFVGRVL